MYACKMYQMCEDHPGPVFINDIYPELFHMEKISPALGLKKLVLATLKLIMEDGKFEKKYFLNFIFIVFNFEPVKS